MTFYSRHFIPLAAAVLFALRRGLIPAQAVFQKKTITTEAAEKLTAACLDWYKNHTVRGKPTIWVVDSNGDTIYVKRIDGANQVGIETARMKAESALYLFRPTRAIGDFAKLQAALRITSERRC